MLLVLFILLVLPAVQATYDTPLCSEVSALRHLGSLNHKYKVNLALDLNSLNTLAHNISNIGPSVVSQLNSEITRFKDFKLPTDIKTNPINPLLRNHMFKIIYTKPNDFIHNCHHSFLKNNHGFIGSIGRSITLNTKYDVEELRLLLQSLKINSTLLEVIVNNVGVHSVSGTTLLTFPPNSNTTNVKGNVVQFTINGTMNLMGSNTTHEKKLPAICVGLKPTYIDRDGVAQLISTLRNAIEKTFFLMRWARRYLSQFNNLPPATKPSDTIIPFKLPQVAVQLSKHLGILQSKEFFKMLGNKDFHLLLNFPNLITKFLSMFPKLPNKFVLNLNQNSKRALVEQITNHPRNLSNLSNDLTFTPLSKSSNAVIGTGSIQLNGMTKEVNVFEILPFVTDKGVVDQKYLFDDGTSLFTTNDFNYPLCQSRPDTCELNQGNPLWPTCGSKIRYGIGECPMRQVEHIQGHPYVIPRKLCSPGSGDLILVGYSDRPITIVQICHGLVKNVTVPSLSNFLLRDSLTCFLSLQNKIIYSPQEGNTNFIQYTTSTTSTPNIFVTGHEDELDDSFLDAIFTNENLITFFAGGFVISLLILVLLCTLQCTGCLNRSRGNHTVTQVSSSLHQEEIPLQQYHLNILNEQPHRIVPAIELPVQSGRPGRSTAN